MGLEHEVGSDEPSLAEVVARYWKRRRLCGRALLFFAGGWIILVVFHDPRAWGDGKIAMVLHGVAWVSIICGGVVAYRANARMAEARGYCQGRFGQLPTSPRPEQPPRERVTRA